jgi:transcriptional regulator with XRE-family HTH domain
VGRANTGGGIRWHWTTSRAQNILRRRSLPEILVFYRRLNQLPLEELGALLGYSTSYISRVETGSRTITDIGALRHIAGRLGLPPHVFGVTDEADADHRAMIQFGQSVLRLTDIARQAGHAAAAVDELWPLIARLEVAWARITTRDEGPGRLPGGALVSLRAHGPLPPDDGAAVGTMPVQVPVQVPVSVPVHVQVARPAPHRGEGA